MIADDRHSLPERGCGTSDSRLQNLSCRLSHQPRERVTFLKSSNRPDEITDPPGGDPPQRNSAFSLRRALSRKSSKERHQDYDWLDFVDRIHQHSLHSRSIVKMTLPMMLRTTTQRGLRSSVAIRTLTTGSAAAAARAARTGFSVTPTRVTCATSSTQRCFATSSSRSFSRSQRRAQPTSKYTASPVTDGEYHKLSNHVLDSLTETFETLLEEADVDTLEETARAKHQGAVRGSPASEWDIECAVRTLSPFSLPSAHPAKRNWSHY